MKIKREQVLNTTLSLANRNGRILMLFFIGSMISFYLNGITTVNAVQAGLCVGYFILSVVFMKYISNNRHFNLSLVRGINDIITIIIFLLTISYYVFFYGYKLFIEFSWLNLLLIFICLMLMITFFRNAVSLNIAMSNLGKFSKCDELDGGNNWNDFINKYQIDNPTE